MSRTPGVGEQSVCQDRRVPGSVPGGQRRLIWWLPSHSGSWPPQGQNPFDLEFDQSNHLEPVFNFECPPRPDMPSSQPIDIPDAKKRNKKKKRCRATDSFSGRFEDHREAPGTHPQQGLPRGGDALSVPGTQVRWGSHPVCVCPSLPPPTTVSTGRGGSRLRTG
uniref:Uncharacterized protein n=1 Tax=Calidris pygmaea TaxID=425635 RepID=A0A8C3K1G2_9CHAR